MKSLLSVTLVLTMPFFVSCQPKKAGRAQDTDEHGHSHEHPGDAVAHPEGPRGPQDIPLRDIPGIRLQSVAEPKPISVWFPAETIPDEASQFVLSSPVNGILGTLLVPPGRHVAAGTALVEVKSPELARLYADWLAARAKLGKAESALAREERLNAKKATSQRDLEEAISEAAIAKAEEGSAALALESLGMALEQGGATWVLRAPKAGTVVNYKAISGQGVGAGQELGFFLASGSVIVRAELIQGAASSAGEGRAYAVRHSSGRRWSARLEGVVPALSAETLRQTYRLRLTGDSLPLPGTPVEVEVPYPASITLPQAALQQVEGRWGVFVGDGSYATFRHVVRGQDVGGEVIVLDGVVTGETIVAEGAYLLKAYQQKLANPEEEGHAH